MRVCHCVGHLTNPGGKCCMDLRSGPTITTTGTSQPPPPRCPSCGATGAHFCPGLPRLRHNRSQWP